MSCQHAFIRDCRGFILCLLCLLFLHTVARAETQPRLTEQAWMSDKAGTMSFQEARAQHFTPFSGVLNKGYTPDTYWIRLTVATSAQHVPVKLRIRPTFLDNIILYSPSAEHPGNWDTRTAGDLHGPQAGAPGINSTGFIIEPEQASTTYYLRINTSSTLLLDVDVLTLNEADKSDARIAIWHFFYFGCVIISMVWSLLEFIQTRQKILLMFALYQGSNFLYEFSLMGYLMLFEPASMPGITNTLTSLFAILALCFASLFHLFFILPYRPSKWLIRLLFAMQAVMFSLPIVYLLGMQQSALQLNVMMTMPSSLLMILLAFSAKQEGVPGLRHLRVLYIALFLTLILFILPLLGVVIAKEWLLQATLVHGLLVTILIFHALQSRNKMIRISLETSQAALVQQKQYADNQTRFIDMLTHQIKTPLSEANRHLDTLDQHTVYSKRIQRALDSIRSIVDRTRLSELTEHQRLVPHIAHIDISALLRTCIANCTEPQRIQPQIAATIMADTDATLLSIIVANLIDNAIKYAREESTIDVSVISDTDTAGLFLHVTNTIGVNGVPDKEQIFEKYYRHPLAQAKSGSGLGLYLSQRLAQMLGGDLRMDADTTTITMQLWLPVHAQA